MIKREKEKRFIVGEFVKDSRDSAQRHVNAEGPSASWYLFRGPLWHFEEVALLVCPVLM